MSVSLVRRPQIYLPFDMTVCSSLMMWCSRFFLKKKMYKTSTQLGNKVGEQKMISHNMEVCGQSLAWPSRYFEWFPGLLELWATHLSWSKEQQIRRRREGERCPFQQNVEMCGDLMSTYCCLTYSSIWGVSRSCHRKRVNWDFREMLVCTDLWNFSLSNRSTTGWAFTLRVTWSSVSASLKSSISWCQFPEWKQTKRCRHTHHLCAHIPVPHGKRPCPQQKPTVNLKLQTK